MTDNTDVPFRLVSMQMHDAESGKMLWDSAKDETWRSDALFTGTEQQAHIPASILRCSAVSRTLEFYSRDLLNDFQVVQTVYLMDNQIEEWKFDFGFVIPGTTNSWQNTIEADPSDMIPVDVLSGNLVIETQFLDGRRLVSSSRVRIFYDSE